MQQTINSIVIKNVFAQIELQKNGKSTENMII